MKVNVVTCEYIDFDQHQFHKFFCHVKLLICKSQCSLMWVHWPKCLKISFLSKRYLISFVISHRLFVVFNNANAVSAEMWVWGFGNHAWNKSLLSSHSSATRDLTRLLYHLWFPKPHTHISYSQHLHNTAYHQILCFLSLIKVIREKSRGGRFLWNRNWDLGWIWAGSATFEAGFFMFSWAKKFF